MKSNISICYRKQIWLKKWNQIFQFVIENKFKFNRKRKKNSIFKYVSYHTIWTGKGKQIWLKKINRSFFSFFEKSCKENQGIFLSITFAMYNKWW